MIKVSKKSECLARAIAYKRYSESGMMQARGADFVIELVGQRWPYFINEAQELIDLVNKVTSYEELDGHYNPSEFTDKENE